MSKAFAKITADENIAADLPHYDSEELLARVKEKDEAAIRLVIRQNNRRLFRIARSIVRDDGEAEDVVQESYLRAFTHISEFRGEASLSTWLSRIVMNEALGRLRHDRAIPKSVSMESSDITERVIPFPLASKYPDPEKHLAQDQIRRLLEKAIDNLPDEFRVVLTARAVEEMSIEETAELLNLKPETVKTRLHRARRLLRAALEEQMGPVLTNAFPFDGRRCVNMADKVITRLASSAPS